jgi:hypothetical protein
MTRQSMIDECVRRVLAASYVPCFQFRVNGERLFLEMKLAETCAACIAGLVKLVQLDWRTHARRGG